MCVVRLHYWTWYTRWGSGLMSIHFDGSSSDIAFQSGSSAIRNYTARIAPSPGFQPNCPYQVRTTLVKHKDASRTRILHTPISAVSKKQSLLVDWYWCKSYSSSDDLERPVELVWMFVCYKYSWICLLVLVRYSIFSFMSQSHDSRSQPHKCMMLSTRFFHVFTQHTSKCWMACNAISCY